MEGQRRLLLGDLPLRGADRRKDGGGCFWGSPAARGCSKEGRSKLSVGELPLRRSARKEGRSNLSALGDLLLRGADRYFDRGTEEAVSGKSPAARGCSMEEGSRIFYYSRPESFLLHLLWDALLFMPSLSAAITVEWAAKPQKRLPYQYVRTHT